MCEKGRWSLGVSALRWTSLHARKSPAHDAEDDGKEEGARALHTKENILIHANVKD
jgi:hypothetical protein